MSRPLPWRIVVVADLGIDSGKPITLDAKTPDAALAALGIKVPIKITGGGGVAPGGAEIAVTGLTSFEPASVAAAIQSQTSSASTASGEAAAPHTAIDDILHDTTFQRIEAAARGLHFFLQHVQEPVRVELLSATRAQLLERIREEIFEPAHRGEVDAPCALLLDFDFAHRSKDLAMLQELAEMAGVLQAPVVAGASADFFELRYFAHVANLPDLMTRFGDAAHAPWRAFQATDRARWVCLTLGRYLQRPAHEVDEIGYKEQVAEAQPESFLWGRGLWLLGAAMARSVQSHGHGLDLSGRGGTFTNMPARTYPHGAEEVALCCEAPLPEMRASEIAWAGFTPVAGYVRRPIVVLPSAVTLFRLRPGRLTIEGTLAYQLLAGRLAQFVTQIISELPTGEAELVTFLKGELAGFLGTLGGEKPEDAVSVEFADQEVDGQAQRLANVQIRPAVPLEGKPLEFAFSIPLR